MIGRGIRHIQVEIFLIEGACQQRVLGTYRLSFGYHAEKRVCCNDLVHSNRMFRKEVGFTPTSASDYLWATMAITVRNCRITRVCASFCKVSRNTLILTSPSLSFVVALSHDHAGRTADGGVLDGLD